VPLILSQPIDKAPQETLRNFDLFDLALNHTPTID